MMGVEDEESGRRTRFREGMAAAMNDGDDRVAVEPREVVKGVRAAVAMTITFKAGTPVIVRSGRGCWKPGHHVHGTRKGSKRSQRQNPYIRQLSGCRFLLPPSSACNAFRFPFVLDGSLSRPPEQGEGQGERDLGVATRIAVLFFAMITA